MPALATLPTAREAVSLCADDPVTRRPPRERVLKAGSGLRRALEHARMRVHPERAPSCARDRILSLGRRQGRHGEERAVAAPANARERVIVGTAANERGLWGLCGGLAERAVELRLLRAPANVDGCVLAEVFALEGRLGHDVEGAGHEDEFAVA